MRLIARNGPLEGGVLTLVDALTLSAPDDGRPLCRFHVSGDGFTVETLDEHVPVIVNGLPVVTRTLEARDELRIGDSQFVVRAEEPAPVSRLAACPVQIRLLSPRVMLQLGPRD